eukprot:gnl/MRDRNA2_/MRDRNA2_99736_c0_seq1.p1 gnl/MRDRNA2_/MRDRNA2_99736_c0~~gnl/MRDRNA2_/MRDRNA2_99736_c0_seq1.p1  ORF type:complete len:729 (+),score=100.55 gnl/MRDRNA2_/MRDRNA2_99736_c0_seq1:43-2187(+)
MSPPSSMSAVLQANVSGHFSLRNDEAVVELLFNDLVERSAEFIDTHVPQNLHDSIPISNRLQALGVSSSFETKRELVRHAQGARLILHPRTLLLLQKYPGAAGKRPSEFAKYLLCERWTSCSPYESGAVSSSGKQSVEVLLSKGQYIKQVDLVAEAGASSVGALTREDRCLSSLLCLSSFCRFISTGHRHNCGVEHAEDSFEYTALCVGVGGVWLSTGSVLSPERELYLVTQGQNTTQQGFGTAGTKESWRSLWAQWLVGSDTKDFPTFEEALAQHTQATSNKKESRYQLLEPGCLLDCVSYKNRMKLAMTPLLLEANAKAKSMDTTAYVVAPLLGWPAHSHGPSQDGPLLLATARLQVEVYAEVIAESDLRHVSDLCLVDFPDSLPDEVHKYNLLPCVRPEPGTEFNDGFPGHDGKPSPPPASHVGELDLLWLDLDGWGSGTAVPGSFANTDLQQQCGQLQSFTKPSFALGWLKRIKMKRDQQIFNSMARQEREIDFNVETVDSRKPKLQTAGGDGSAAGQPPEGWICIISTMVKHPATNEPDVIASFVKKVVEEDTHGLIRAVVIYCPSDSVYYHHCFEDHKLVTAISSTWDELLVALAALRSQPPARERFAPQDSTGQKVSLQFFPYGSARSKAPNSLLRGPDAGKLLVRCYDLAEGGCALPGNTYWLGRPSSTSGAALVAASTVGELQNPFINPALCSAPPCILPTPQGL